jgi:predicted metal-dependent HD superfamily phosphohydrolase
MVTQQLIVNEAEQYIKSLLRDHLTSDHKYHDLGHTLKVREVAVQLSRQLNCTDEEIEIMELACLFHDSGFVKVYEGHEAISKQIAEAFLTEKNYPGEKIDQVLKLIEATYPSKHPANKLEEIIKDADLNNLGSEHYFNYLEALRHEWDVFLNMSYEEEEWYKLNYKFVNNHIYYTSAAQELLGEKYKENRKRLKALRPGADKKKKKGKGKKNPQPDIVSSLIGGNKSAQMMFKTSLRNHLDLAALADNKANIMLSVNALIITIVIPLAASYVADGRSYLLIPMLLLLLTCLFSMVFATLATRPIRMEGHTNAEQIKNGKSNLFFFGNFYKMKFEDYQAGMMDVLAEESKLDGSIMRDLYYLGSSLGSKYRQLRLCYTIFMWGIIVTVAAFGLSYGLLVN